MSGEADTIRPGRDYLERTIATVRNHRSADNCWPQWANIFADEIEWLWAENERYRDALATADAEASVAHDAIWNVEEHARIYEREPRRVPILHDATRNDSANAAIWRLHAAVRAALAGGGDA